LGFLPKIYFLLILGWAISFSLLGNIHLIFHQEFGLLTLGKVGPLFLNFFTKTEKGEGFSKLKPLWAFISHSLQLLHLGQLKQG